MPLCPILNKQCGNYCKLYTEFGSGCYFIDVCVEVSKKLSYGQMRVKPRIPQRIRFDYENEEWLGIDKDLLTRYKIAYPHVDVETELGQMRLWLSNPSNPKRSDFMRFVTSWLKKSEVNNATRTGAICTGTERENLAKEYQTQVESGCNEGGGEGADTCSCDGADGVSRGEPTEGGGE